MNEDLTGEFEKRIEDGKDILQILSTMKIDGVSKLQNKVKQELNFLQKSLKSGNVKKEHLICSNLTHLRAVTEQLVYYRNNCVFVMSNKTLSYEDGSSRKICVDLVLDNGFVWMKVVARNAKALTLVSSGEGCYGQRSIIDQAEEFKACSKEHLHFFKQPTVIFYFANGVENELAEQLQDIGIMVHRQNSMDQRIPTKVGDCHEGQEAAMTASEATRSLEILGGLREMKLNLCVTTLLAYVSSLTNGAAHRTFRTDILNEYAHWERRRPVKPVLDQLFQGRELYCCETAARDFEKILSTVGGPGERERGSELMGRVRVVPDTVLGAAEGSGSGSGSGRMKPRSLAIIGTGQALQAVTVTANHGLARAAPHAAVFLHEPRALAEGKQLAS